MKKIFLLFGILFAVSSLVNAADVVVTSADDSGDGTFRTAMGDSNNITFNIPGTDVITLASNISFDASRTITVDGINQATGNPIEITVGTSLTNSLFKICTGSTTYTPNITIKNLIIRDVNCTSNGAAFSSGSGAYQTAGVIQVKVTIENCYIKNCSTTLASTANSGGGGGYFVSHGTDLTVKNCTFEGCSVTKTGGYTNNAYGGGAIGSTGNNTAKITVINSTFINNSSNGRGGAIHTGHPITIINSTIVGNTSAKAAGVYLNNANTHNFVNNIIALNSGTLDSSSSDLNKIDIEQASNTTVNLSNCIIGKNNIGSLDANSISFTESLDIFASGNPVLANNGGLVPTIALSSTSIALGAGIDEYGTLPIPTTDQRGKTRPAPPSIGAYDILVDDDDDDDGTLRFEQVAAPVFSAFAAGNQIEIAPANAGWVSVYNLTGNVINKVYVSGNTVLPTVLVPGIYLVQMAGNNGNISVAKVLVKR